MGAERIVGVTGSTLGGMLRVIDVDAKGVPQGSATYVPANVPQVPLEIGPEGLLIENRVSRFGLPPEEIDWSEFEVTDTNLSSL